MTSLSAPEPPRYDYIDTLRGIAVMAVIASHLDNFFHDMSWHVFTIAQFGAHGVQLFFVVSALTLTMSWRARHDGAVHFWVRRLFRIAPMFWLALVVYGGLNAAGVWPTGGSDPRSLLLTFAFLHEWSMSAINLVVPGGWTIGVEMSFYAIFPFVVTRVTSLWRAVALVAATWVFACTANSVAPHFLAASSDEEINYFVYYWLPHAMPVFAMGILTYYLLPMAPRSNLVGNGFRVLAVLLVLYASWLPVPWVSELSHPISRVLFASTASMLLTLSLARSPAPWLVNRLTRHVGRVSFSAYLVHFGLYDPMLRYFGPFHGGRYVSVVVFVLFFLSVVAITVGISTLTYRYIEKPGIRCGERFLRRRAVPAVA